MRIRNNRFQIKFNLNDVISGKSSGHTECTEVDLGLDIKADQQSLLKKTLDSLTISYPDNIISPFDLFDHHNWKESVVINKTRSLYVYDNHVISLDNVSDIGLLS